MLLCREGSLLAGLLVYFWGFGIKNFTVKQVRKVSRLVQSIHGIKWLEDNFGTLSIADNLRLSVGIQNREIL